MKEREAQRAGAGRQLQQLMRSEEENGGRFDEWRAASVRPGFPADA